VAERRFPAPALAPDELDVLLARRGMARAAERGRDRDGGLGFGLG